MNLKGSQTEKNLLASFAGESQARNRYTYFASAARKEGFEQIAAIFTETAENEKEHAKIFFKFLEGGEVEITASYPAGVIGKTVENLKSAADGEKMEWTALYKDFEKIAHSEGFGKIAETFKTVAGVEAEHERRYRILLKNVKEGTAFKKTETANWRCRNCGHIHKGKDAPETCPVCNHPRGFFEIAAENY